MKHALKIFGGVVTLLLLVSLALVGFGAADDSVSAPKLAIVSAALHDGCVLSIVGDSSVSEDGKHGFTAVCTDGHVHTFTWNVSDPTIATIDGNGVLSPLKTGKVTITVTDDGGCSVSKTITVVKKDATDSALHDGCVLSIVGDSSVSEDGKHGFTAVCTDGHVHTFTWSVSDPTIATIDGNGVLSPLKTGKVTITVTDDGGCSVSKTITVVKKDAADSALHDGCVLSIVGDSSVSEDGKHGFTAVCTDGHVHTFTWNVSDPTIATIDGNGLFSPLKVGTVTITVTDDGGCSVSKTITVVKKDTSSAQTPFPVLGILAGLGAAAVFLRRH